MRFSNKYLTFSVIINTLDRAQQLRTLLLALDQQSYPYFEVIVVVGPTRDNTMEMLQEFQGRLRVLRCPDPNLSRSRNLGLLAACGEAVAYLDDDALPSQRWLEQLALLFNTTTIAGTGGAVYAIHPNFSLTQFRQGLFSSLGEQVDVPSRIVDRVSPSGMSYYWFERVMGTNMAFLRKDLLECGGFDEFYEYIAEEVDLVYRLNSSSAFVVQTKEAVVYHIPASSRNRNMFTPIGTWWYRTRSRIYFGIKNGIRAGDPFSVIFRRTLRTSGANGVLYLNLLLEKQISYWKIGRMMAMEIPSIISGIFHALFKRRQLLHQSEVKEALERNLPILQFQNGQSAYQPSVDPVTGKQPTIEFPRSPLRICLLSGTYPPEQVGGISRLTHLMAQGLFELGNTVHVVTRGEREQIRFYDGAYVHTIPHSLNHYSSLRGYHNLYMTLNYSHNVYDKVKRLILNDGIQIVDSPLWQYEGLVPLISGVIPVVVRLVTGIRQISDIHHTQVEDFRLMGDLEQYFIENAYHIFPNTQATLESMSKLYDLSRVKDRCTVVSYGIIPVPDSSTHPFDPSTFDQHKQWNVLFVGRLEKRKGILDLFEAIPRVIERVPNVKFIIAGADNSRSDGFYMQTGMDYVTFFHNKYSRWLTSVDFLGKVEEDKLQQLYQNCDLFVAPSLYESFGLIYLEAMNYAKPVIGCHAGGIPEVVNHGETGLLVEPSAPKLLAAAIVSLFENPIRLREMGLAARAQILLRFNYLEMARNFEQVYRKLIAKSNALREGAKIDG
jgi:hypothetical protein